MVCALWSVGPPSYIQSLIAHDINHVKKVKQVRKKYKCFVHDNKALSLRIKTMNLSASEEFSETFEFYVEGLLLMIVAIIGIIGNVLFILLFSCRANKINTFHSLMVSLAWADSVYLSSSLFVFAVKSVLFLVVNQ